MSAMRMRVPSKKIRERVLLFYELEGCEEAVDSLTKYCGIKPIRIILNGREAGDGGIAVYFQNRAYFTKRGLNKQTILHELYHHLVHIDGLDMSPRMKKKGANSYARELLN